MTDMVDSVVKDALSFIALVIAGLAAFFNLRGRVSVVEARQKDDRETARRTAERVEKTLARIESKLDRKADK